MAILVDRSQGGLGYKLGQGLGSAVSGLLQNKLNVMLQSKNEQHLRNAGYGSQEAQFLSQYHQDPQLQMQLAQRLQGSDMQQTASPAQSVPALQQLQTLLSSPGQSAGMQNALRALGVEGAFAPSRTVTGQLTNGQTEQQPQQDRLAQSLLQSVQQRDVDRLQNKLPQIPGLNLKGNKAEQMAAQQPVLQQVQQPQIPQQTIADTLRTPQVTPAQQLQKEKLTVAEQNRVSKETKPFFDEVLKEGNVASKSNKRLSRIEEINEKGYLGIPVLNSIAKTISNGVFGIGLDLSGLMTADAQELDKLSTDFIKDAKDFFGTRLTDADLKAFIRTIPTLSQSQEGRRRVISNLRSFNDAAILKEDAMKKIVKANGGKRPENLQLLVEEIVAPQLEQMAQKFKEQPVGSNEQQSTGRSIAQLLGAVY